MRRKRGPEPKDPRLAPYPGLTEVGGYYYVRHPVTKKRGSLGTNDLEEAIVRYHAAKARWKDEVEEMLADEIVGKILDLASTTVSINHKKASGLTLGRYAARVREEYLGVRYDENDRVMHPVTPKMVSKTKIDSRKGKPIAVRTARDYASMSRFQIERSPKLAFPLSTERDKAVMYVRAFLKDWMDKAQHYNHLRNYISKVYQTAIMEGLCVTNPCDDIEQLATRARKVYIPDDAYIAITSAMATDQIYNTKTERKEPIDTEWQARAVDLLYLISGRPGDVLQFPDDQYVIDANTGTGMLKYRTGKTDTPIELELNAAVVELVQWFRDWKKAQDLVSPYLVCTPTYYRLNHRHRDKVGQPITVNYLSKRFREAAMIAHRANPDLKLYDEETGKYRYRLYDNRGRGLTDERRNNEGKPTGKGGHRDDRSERIYITDEVPVRAKATLARIGGK